MTGELSGRVVWRELSCCRPVEVGRFVAGLFGWDLAADGAGLVLRAGQRRVARVRGVLELSARPEWLIHIAVDNLAQSLAQVEPLGGEIKTAVEVLPELGARGLIADPLGALCYLVEPRGSLELQADGDRLHDFFWAELACRQPRQAASFYCSLLGWTSQPAPYVDLDLDLHLLCSAGRQVGSAVADPELAGSEAGWLSYAVVPDLLASCELAQELGGRVERQPVSLPSLGQFAGISDPTGARLVLWQHTRG